MLSLLLFIVYVNDLVEELSEKVSVSGFADDLAVWRTGADLKIVDQQLQEAVDAVKVWTEKWLMKVNINKCSTKVFSKNPVDAKIQAEVKWKEEKLAAVATPKFLGVSIDSGLHFVKHCQEVCDKGRKRLRLLRCLAGSDWGWKKGLLKATYIARVETV